ncbi:iron-containing alcohol dehydrogenase [Streptococcus ruminantium]|uniref:Iron-containing alcohol dehydrogenase n=1 Tax=Streptococcus ruminantium TaxID=1917441 RepID=A0ABU1B2L6_9STRE|nr:iron-containing alcohol dehydrogenase [Streptococcus ruminantium]MDQ8759279.1 iron-containing alcohol dehydrogenase [Streptococcus ruminantium]MDQ8764178.1 iron-containing alcohol dehydrogenase [Streptococcus ruminantium]MDQ8766742.1 iron-containing alcohol dehydrogenase [Streptococcus ruminantium]MDQ8768345.1 iron-containing alcohol dehydrogenase [Streptococcus ruminantium]MDQ8774886.1 iron-containing alcohol dehydrogenase [Streptococcus ruminantium]
MRNFRLQIPTDIRFGRERLAELPEVLSAFGKRVLFAYGGGSIKKSGLYDKITQLLNENDFTVVELAGIEPNPRIESVRQGASLIRDNDLEVILAVGGGSVVDASKVMAAAVYYDGDAWDLVEDSSLIGKAIPIVDVLTLAATGTEMNRDAVISNMAINEKLDTSGWELIPRASFLDPSLTFTVSKWQTAAGAADMMSHLFEQYFNRTEGVDVQDSIAEGLLKTIIKHAPVAIQEPENYTARANLLWASTLALNGLVSKGRIDGWTCHPIEHELSAYYDITHGIGLAILTPRWMKFCIDTDPTTHTKFATYARTVWGLDEGSDEELARQAVAKTYHFFESQLEIPMTLPEVGIENQDLVREMSEKAVEHGNLGQNIFVTLDVSDVEQIISASFNPMKTF